MLLANLELDSAQMVAIISTYYLRRTALFWLRSHERRNWQLMEGNATYLTAAGKRKLEEELDYLRTVRRSEVASHIKQAKEDGDISENAGYETAKDEQAFVEGRIRTLEVLLSRAQIIEAPRSRGAVSVGSTVTVVEEGGKPEAFQIVGPPESDPSEGRISDQSPLGRSLLGREAGDRVLVRSPGGTRQFQIIEVS